MAKMPYMQFYTGDWLRDPNVSMLSPMARGIWIDALAAMHEQDRQGYVTGTAEQLARVCRCSTSEMTQAIMELDHTHCADVSHECHSLSQNGPAIVTLKNRRMSRDHKNRVSAANRKANERHRKKKGGRKDDVSRIIPPPDTPHMSEVRSQKSDVSQSDRQACGGPEPTEPEALRTSAIESVQRLMGRALSIPELDRFDSWSASTPEEHRAGGKTFSRYALICAACSSAIQSIQASPNSLKGATTYLQRIIDRCVETGCAPGEFKASTNGSYTPSKRPGRVRRDDA